MKVKESAWPSMVIVCLLGVSLSSSLSAKTMEKSLLLHGFDIDCILHQPAVFTFEYLAYTKSL